MNWKPEHKALYGNFHGRLSERGSKTALLLVQNILRVNDSLALKRDLKLKRL